MKKRFTPVLISVLVFQLTVGLSLVGYTQEPEDPIDSASLSTSQPDQPLTPNSPVYSQQALDQMLAPIALYPDALLSQILMAATYPLEVVEAARWSKANPQLKDDQAVQAVQDMTWDPSVKALVAFPEILMQMDEKLTWMQELGDAFLSQQPAVMDTVQALRQKAQDTGHLSSNDKIQVTQEDESIAIASANPQVIYVPYYDPLVVYGPWWWAGYPPVYWPLWPGYYPGLGLRGGIYWGVGIGVGTGFFFGGFNYSRHQVYVGRGSFRRTWQHSPGHRRGVPYRDQVLRQQFGRGRVLSQGRGEFRGYGIPKFNGGAGRGNRVGAPRGSGSRLEQSGRSFSQADRQPHAFDGVGHGADVQRFGSRGRESYRGSSARSSGVRGSGSRGGRSGGGGEKSSGGGGRSSGGGGGGRSSGGGGGHGGGHR